MSIEEDILENPYQNNKKGSFKYKKAITISNTKMVSKFKAIEVSKVHHNYKAFTLLRMKTKETLKRLESQGLIKPIGPKPDVPKDRRSSKYDINAYCN